MPTTTNLSLPYPQASDSVDVPRDIQALANALDTKAVKVSAAASPPASPTEGMLWYQTDTDLLVVYNGSAWTTIGGGNAAGNSGLVYIASTTVGSAVSTVTINNCFSSTYDCYRVVYSGGTGSVITGVALRVGGSSASYRNMLMWGTPGAATVNNASLTSGPQAEYMGGMTTNFAQLVCDVNNPYISTLYTTFSGGSYIATDIGFASCVHEIKQSNTSVTLLPQSGTITGGTVTVYGYRKA